MYKIFSSLVGGGEKKISESVNIGDRNRIHTCEDEKKFSILLNKMSQKFI